LLIFSDVDGTLLDAEGRCLLPPAALQSAARLHQIVLASSRDLEELQAVQHELGWHGDLIAEDGAALLYQGQPERLGVARDELIRRLRDLLVPAEADRLLASEPREARGRTASLLLPIAAATPMLRQRLEAAGLRMTPGGRWATITAESTKGTAAGVLATRLGVPRWAAIGNAPNDATLLGEAWRSFVFRNPEGHDPVLARIDGAVLLSAPGPEGWLEMLDLLDRPTGDAPGKERQDDDAAVDHHHPDDSRT